MTVTLERERSGLHLDSPPVVHRWSVGRRRLRTHLRDTQPRHGRDARPHRRSRQGRRRPGCARRPGRLRGGPLVPDDRLRARPHHLAHRRPDRAVRRRARPARIARQRQALRGRPRRRHPARGRAVPLHWPGGPPRSRATRSASRCPTCRASEFHAYTLREPIGVVGADHPVELPAAHGGLEAGPGPHHRQHGDPQARRADAAVRSPAGRDHGRGGPARRRGQRRCPATARPPGPRWPPTTGSTRSPSPARPRSAS